MEQNSPAVGARLDAQVMPAEPKRATVFVCLACGKRSKDRYGVVPISRGWDESCMLNARECYVDALTVEWNGRVVDVADGGILPEPPIVPRTPEQIAADDAELQAEARKTLEALGAYGSQRA